MTRAPLYEKLKALSRSGELRMHMPGHKGGLPFAPELSAAAALDYTELEETGSLYEGCGVIAEAEALAARAFRAENALFLAGGATQGIFSALLYASRRGKSVVMARGSHLAAYNACALLGLEPRYLYQDTMRPFGCFSPITAEAVEKELQKAPAAAVFITSPSYYGVVSDLGAIGSVCRRHGALLIADAAHGAHLPFLPGFENAVSGADIAIVSAHKTLPALGMASLLLLHGPEPDALRRCSADTGTSSPSYLVMASIDASRAWMEDEGRLEYARAAKKMGALRSAISSRGVFRALEGAGLDPLRLVVNTASGGLNGFDAYSALEREFYVVPEMADYGGVVCIVTGMDGDARLERLSSALLALEGRAGKAPLPEPPEPPGAVRAVSLYDALRAPRETLEISKAAGRVSGRQITVYPPGIPLVAAGEIIEQKHLAYLREMRYNMNRPIEVLT